MDTEVKFEYRVVLCRPKKPMILSKLLMKFQDTEFSHSAIIHGPNMIVEAHWPLARKKELNKWLEDYLVVEAYSFEAPISLYPKYEKVLKSYIGTWYSVMQLGAIFLQNTIKPISKFLGKASVNGSKLSICTEVCIMVIKATKDYKLKESRDMVDLRELKEACLAHGKRIDWSK